MRNIFGIEDDEETSEESPIRSDDTNTDKDGIPNLDADIESPLSMDE